MSFVTSRILPDLLAVALAGITIKLLDDFFRLFDRRSLRQSVSHRCPGFRKRSIYLSFLQSWHVVLT